MRRPILPYGVSQDEMAALGARLLGHPDHEPVPRKVSGPDDRVPLSLTYVQVGMVLAALSILQGRMNGHGADLAQREVEALRRDINEQVQETASTAFPRP